MLFDDRILYAYSRMTDKVLTFIFWVPFSFIFLLTQYIRKFRHAFAVSFIFCGLPLVWVLREAIGITNIQLFTWIVMATVVMILPQFKGHLYGDTKAIVFPLSFLAYLIVISFASGIPEDNGFIYLLFVFSVFVGLMTVPTRNLILVPILFLFISALSCVITVGNIILNDIELIGRIYAGDSNSPNQLSFVGGLAMVSGLFVLFNHVSTNRWTQFLSYMSILLGLIIVILSVTRSTVLGLVLCAVICIFFKITKLITIQTRHDCTNAKIIKAKKIGARITILLLFLLGGYLYAGDIVSVYFFQFITYFQKGILSYFYGITGIEESAETRYYQIYLALNGIFEYPIAGHGYKSLYVDFPILQSFYDLGLFGGIYFLIIALLLPIIFIIRTMISVNSPALQRFVAYVYVYFTPNLILHGQPYDYPLWLPIVLLFRFIKFKK